MPLCVLDASVTIAALIEEDRSDEARRILRDVVSDSATVPGLWLLEVGNVLLLAERRKSLSAAARRDHLADLSRLPIVIDHATASHAWHDTMALAERHGLTLYRCRVPRTEPASAVANCNIRRGAATGGGGGERAAAVTEVADGL